MGTPFNDRSPDLWQTYAHTARSLLTNGVPLKNNANGALALGRGIDLAQQRSFA